MCYCQHRNDDEKEHECAADLTRSLLLTVWYVLLEVKMDKHDFNTNYPFLHLQGNT